MWKRAVRWLNGRCSTRRDPTRSGLNLRFAPCWRASRKRMIYLFMDGAPTHVDLFDYKPKLTELHGTPIPDEYLAGKRFSTMTGNAKGKLVLAPVEPFKQRGRSGAWVSNFLPYTAEIAD